MGSRNRCNKPHSFDALRCRLRRLADIKDGLFVFSTHRPAARHRILRIDTLERRELFAVLSGLVYEDINGDRRFDPAIESPAAQQLVFLDQNGNHLLDSGEATAYSDAFGIAEFQLDFGTWGVILPAPRLQDSLDAFSGSVAYHKPDLMSQATLSVAAFDTVFRGDDGFNPTARLAGGLTDWLVIPSFAEGEDDLDPSGIFIVTKSVDENESTSQEAGEILLHGDVPPDGWTWWVSDERFEVVGNKIVTKVDHEIDFERESEIVMVVEGIDTSAIGAQSVQPYRTTIAIPVVDRNDAPTGIQLNGQTVVERLAGAAVGTVEVIDQDLGEGFEFAVSDARFEITGGLLRLRSDIALFFNLEQFVDLTISARSLYDSTHYIEAAVRIDVLPNSAPWTNGDSPLDVNSDGVINSTDALIIINLLNTSGGTLVLPPVANSRTTRSTPDYVDVNADGKVGAIDALIVINRLRRGNSLGTASDGNDHGTTGSSH